MQDVIDAIQQIVITAGAVMAALGLGWMTVGKKIHGSIFGEDGWLHRLDQRFQTLEDSQEEDRKLADVDRRASAERNAEVSRKMDQFSIEQREQRKQLVTLSDNHQALALTVAKLEGKEEARAEAAQLAGAASRIAEAITHPQEEAPRHDQL